jgi:hypothetical protein
MYHATFSGDAELDTLIENMLNVPDRLYFTSTIKNTCSNEIAQPSQGIVMIKSGEKRFYSVPGKSNWACLNLCPSIPGDQESQFFARSPV